MKNIKILLLLIITFVSYSCDNFDEINTNENAANNVTSSLLATPLILDMMATNGYASNFIEDNCLAKQMIWMEFLHEYNYNLLGRAGLSGYKTLTNANKMIEVAEDNQKNTYEALSLFVKCYKLFYYSMHLGDIPYTDALQGEEGNIKPKYDTQKEVMINILNDLEKASNLFAEGVTFEGDPIYQGDPLKWRKAIDTFRLKILMHLSKKENDGDLNIKSKFRTIVQSGKLMESNTDNLQLVFSDKAGQQYPFNRIVSRHYYYCTISTVIIDTLKTYNDYRLYHFAQPAEAQLKKGLASDDPEAYLGLDPAADFAVVQTLYANGQYSAMNLRYTDVVTGEPYIKVGYAEQQFILAEAVLRGWIEGDPTEYYNEGIRASMQFVSDNTPDDETFHYGKRITDEYISSYLQSDKILLKGDFNHKLKQIICQKYLTYYMQYPFEAYYEYRRTGYPELPINPETNRNSERDKIPVRWMYPTREFDYNRENVEEAVERQYGGVDDINKLMWILR